MAVPRRDILRWMAVSMAASVSCREPSATSTERSAPVTEAGRAPSAEPVRAGAPVRLATSEVPPDGRRVVWYGDVPVEVRRRADGFEARSLLCTHFGCPVKWVDEKSSYKCPCHNGEFSDSGDVVGGPPTRPLRRIPVERVGEVLVIGGGS